jgi:hypothetical protein
MKTCIVCKNDITNQTSYRGKYCIPCDNKTRWDKKKNKLLNIIPEIINNIPENHKKCKKCNTILKNDEFRPKKFTCKKCENTYRKEYYYKNILYELERKKNYKLENREKINSSRRIYQKNKYNNDIQYKLETCIRSRLREALKNNKKGDKSICYLGCSINELKDWLNYNFKNEMTFENHGIYWQIDHIIPCALFDFRNEKDIYECFHWSNLAPLESEKNINKSSKIDTNMIEYYKVQKDKFIKSKSTQQE